MSVLFIDGLRYGKDMSRNQAFGITYTSPLFSYNLTSHQNAVWQFTTEGSVNMVWISKMIVGPGCEAAWRSASRETGGVDQRFSIYKSEIIWLMPPRQLLSIGWMNIESVKKKLVQHLEVSGDASSMTTLTELVYPLVYIVSYYEAKTWMRSLQNKLA